QLQLDLLSCRHFLRDIAPPRGEDIGPRFDRVKVAGVAREPETARPAVIVMLVHRGAPPLRLVCRAIEQRRADYIMAVTENVGTYMEEIADDAFGRVATTVDLRVDGFDDHAIVRRPCRMLCDSNHGLVGSGNLFALANGRPSRHSSWTRFFDVSRG